MKINAMIVDDDQKCIDALKVCLENFPYMQIIGELSNAKQAFRFINDSRNKKPEVVFLDIEMDEMDGIKLASQLQVKYPDIMVIFITGHPGFALQGYEVYPVDFLTKPVNVLRLQKTLKVVLERLSNLKKRGEEERKIGLNAIGGIQMINVNDIRYIEKRGRKIFVICQNNESFISKDTMKNFETILDSFHFYRAHQSFLVPINRIKAIIPDAFSRSFSILLNDNGTSLPLSRNKYHELKDILEHEARGLTVR